MFRKLQAVFRDFGVLDGSLLLFSRCCSKVSNHFRFVKYYIYCQPVESAFPPCKRRFRNIEVFEIGPNEKAYRKDFPPRADSIVDDRFFQSARCFVAYKNGKFTGFLWFVKDRYIEDEIRCRYVLKPEGAAVWDFDVYVVPQARFGGTFLELWHQTFETLQQEDIHWSVSRISAFNRNSLRSHERLGAYRIGSVFSLSVFSFQILFSTFKPYFSISMTKTPDVFIHVHPNEM